MICGNAFGRDSVGMHLVEIPTNWLNFEALILVDCLGYINSDLNSQNEYLWIVQFHN